MALQSLDNLERKSNIKMRYTLLTVDVLIIDEAGQWSAEQLSFLDILLRNLRNTNHAFGGVLLLCSMDHAQLGSIKGLPFLISTFILSTFTLVGLSQSVRAHDDEKFQRLQDITRMRADYLKENESTMKGELMDALDCLTYVKTMDDPLITPNTQRMFAKKDMSLKASQDYVRHTINLLTKQKKQFTTCRAKDYQKNTNSRADFTLTTNEMYTARLNKKTKEPDNIVFFKGALFEATKNTHEFQHSRLLLLYDIPDQNDVDNMNDIKLLMPPIGLNCILFSPDDIPDKETLLHEGWTEVTVGTEPIVTTQFSGKTLKRHQYWLQHIGASTIHRQMGNTIYGNCVFEFDKQSKPWLKEQIVVLLSRTCMGCHTIIVGKKEEFGEMVWKLLLKKTQWTDYIDTILSNMTVNSEGGRNFISRNIQMAEEYPYRTCDLPIPNDYTGYVYYIVSTADVDYKYGYIGETENLAVRFYEHNTGYGSKGTRDAVFRPYALAGYICGMGHMTDSERMSLERRWRINCQVKRLNKLEDVLDEGEEIVQKYNDVAFRDGYEQILFVQTIVPRSLKKDRDVI
jgi:predicted GIY-YIG superfamily endonuclease